MQKTDGQNISESADYVHENQKKAHKRKKLMIFLSILLVLSLVPLAKQGIAGYQWRKNNNIIHTITYNKYNPLDQKNNPELTVVLHKDGRISKIEAVWTNGTCFYQTQEGTIEQDTFDNVIGILASNNWFELSKEQIGSTNGYTQTITVEYGGFSSTIGGYMSNEVRFQNIVLAIEGLLSTVKWIVLPEKLQELLPTQTQDEENNNENDDLSESEAEEPSLSDEERAKLAIEVIENNKKTTKQKDGLQPIMLLYGSGEIQKGYDVGIIGVYEKGRIKSFEDYAYSEKKLNYHDYVIKVWDEGGESQSWPDTAETYHVMHPANEILYGDEVVYVYSRTKFIGKARLCLPPEISFYGNGYFLSTELRFEQEGVILDPFEMHVAILGEHNALPHEVEIINDWGSLEVDLDGDDKKEQAEFTRDFCQVPLKQREEEYWPDIDDGYYDPYMLIRIQKEKQKLFLFAGNMTLDKEAEFYECGIIGAFDLDGDGVMEIVADLIYGMSAEADIISIKKGKLVKSHTNWVSLN